MCVQIRSLTGTIISTNIVSHAVASFISDTGEIQLNNVVALGIEAFTSSNILASEVLSAVYVRVVAFKCGYVFGYC